jgi:hypothetical protein
MTRQSKLQAAAVTLFALVLAPACEKDPGDPTDSHADDSSSSADEGNSSTSADSGEWTPPPGCSDGGGPEKLITDGDQDLLWTSSVAACGEPPEFFSFCAFDDFQLRFHFDQKLPGTYDLGDPDSGLSATLELYYDHPQTEDGCSCTDTPTMTDVPVSEGIVTLAEYEGQDGSPVQYLMVEGMTGPGGFSGSITIADCG